eukprot:g14416.t1
MKESMAKKGLSEEAQEKILPKTRAEKLREARLAKLSDKEKIQNLTYELGNLTNSVIELQKLAADHYGIALEYPANLGDKAEGDEGADGADGADGDKTQPNEAGGGEAGDAPTVNLRGFGAGGHSDGSADGDGDAVDAGGKRTRRLLWREGGEPEGQTGPAAAAEERGS